MERMDTFEQTFFSGEDFVRIRHDEANVWVTKTGNKKCNKLWYDIGIRNWSESLSLDLEQVESLAPTHLGYHLSLLIRH